MSIWPDRTLLRPALRLVLLGGLVGAVGAGTVAQAEEPRASAISSSSLSGCDEVTPPPGATLTASRDLYCVFLTARPGLSGISGHLELRTPPTPFGVAVNAAGNHLYEGVLTLNGLPEPGELGDYEHFVAWLTTPLFETVVKLGTVENGSRSIGEISLNKFMILVTAEVSADADEWAGRLLLRATSPSARMSPPDMQEFMLGATGGGMAGADTATAGNATESATAQQHEHGTPTDRPHPWPRPAMIPGLTMFPALMALEAPAVTPFLPRDEVADPASLPLARPREIIQIADGDSITLEAGLVRRRMRSRDYVMYAFNGQYPGPLLHVPQASTVVVNFINSLAWPTTIHWHGLRLDNASDGVPGLTQDPVQPGESFRYEIFFADPGIYWYHPHHREDVLKDLGLYGNMLVEPDQENYYAEVDREEVLMLDDFLLAGDGTMVMDGAEGTAMTHDGYVETSAADNTGQRETVEASEADERTQRAESDLPVATGENTANSRAPTQSGPDPMPFGRERSTHALMGRFGNLMLVNGEPDYRLDVSAGEVIRLYLTNVSNVRTFNLSFEGEAGATARIKVVGTDVGAFEREEWVESIVLSPAERYIVHVNFAEAGEALLANRVQGIDHLDGSFFAETDTLGVVAVSEGQPTTAARSFDTLRTNPHAAREIALFREHFDRPVDLELTFTMRSSRIPFVVEQLMRFDSAYFHPVEWSGTMPMMNWNSTSAEVEWIVREPATGHENMDIDWRFKVGDVVKIRLHNERRSFHGMQHPFHIHGQRFLVLARNGIANENLAWKDTVLLPTGTTTDILLDITNPGKWMAHCHISEHLEAGMRTVFTVVP